MNIKSLGIIPALACAAGISIAQQSLAQGKGGHGGNPPPQLSGSGGPILPGSGNPPPPPTLSGSDPELSGTGNPPPPPWVSGSNPELSGSGNPPPPPWVSGSNPNLSGSDPELTGSGNPPPPPGLSGSGGPVVTGSGSPVPPWANPLHGGSLESLTIGVAFVPTSGTSTSATGLLQAVSFSGTDRGALVVRTTGLPGGVYTVSAVTDSGTDSITLGTFKVRVAATTGTSAHPPAHATACFGGPRGIPFPSGLDPFTIASLGISDSNANVLFTADLTTVTNGVFTANTPLVTGTSVAGATGGAEIHAFANAGVISGSLVVNAKGLPDNTTYTYAINGTDIGAITTGSAGSLHLIATEKPTGGTLPNTVNLFTITAVTIHDGDGNIILSASF